MENRSFDNIIKSSLEDFKVDIPKDWAFMEDMLNAEESTPIDEAAKSELQNMEVPFDIAAWTAMESALDNLELAGIDDAAKSALEDFETPYKPDDWLIMERKLDTAFPNAVDEMAKVALSEFAVPFVPLDWAMMEGQLDDAGFPHEVDNAVKAALFEYESAQPSNWSAMETSLTEAEDVRRQLVITKSIELVLFIFAIWTIGNLLPFNQASNSLVIPPTENIEQEDVIPQAILNNSKEETVAQNDVKTDVENSINENNKIQNLSIISTTNTKSTVEKVVNTNQDLFQNPVQQIITDTKPTELVLPRKEENITDTKKGKNSEPLAMNIPKEELNFIDYENNQRPLFKRVTKNEPVILPVATKVLHEVKSGKSFRLNSDLNYITPPLNTDISTNEIYAAVNQGTVEKVEDNFINQPVASFINTKLIDEVKLEKELKSNINSKYITPPLHLKASVSPQYAIIDKEKGHIAKGFATNLGIDYAISEKLEVSLGLSYNRNHYVYREFMPLANSSEPQVIKVNRNVKLDIGNVPIRLNFNIRKDKKTRLYALGGITVGIFMKEDKTSGEASLINDVTSASYRSIVDNSEEAIAAGSFSDSDISARAFVTADIGLGLEYKTNSRFSFFIEPLFQRSIKGIGKDDEVYQNYSLALGSRMML